MSRIWLRLELFEIGLLQFPSKCTSSLTLANVKESLNILHRLSFSSKNGEEMSAIEAEDKNLSTFVESDNFNYVNFQTWKDAVAHIFKWREQDYKAFWLLLVYFHRKIPVKAQFCYSSDTTDQDCVPDADQCLVHEKVPIFKLAIFLFIQMVRPHSWEDIKKSQKQNSDKPEGNFDRIWYREQMQSESLARGFAASAVATSPIQLKLKPGINESGTSGGSTNVNGSPTLRPNPRSNSPLIGSASPPGVSPHMMGMKDRLTSDTYYLEFIRTHLDDLMALLFPSLDLTTEDCNTRITAEQADLLGFLLCAGSRELLDTGGQLSQAYPYWSQESTVNMDMEGDENNAMAIDSISERTENGTKLCSYLKRNLLLNETLYPPVGYSPLTPTKTVSAVSPQFALTSSLIADPFSLAGSAAPDSEYMRQSPTIVASLNKSTVIKRGEEFADRDGASDLVIFACHDSFIYILGPMRHIMITACKNCTIVTAPNTGVFFLDRCENVRISAISGLIRVSNCLDSVIHSLTLSPMIMTGENVGVKLGPYNTKYTGLAQQLQRTHFPLGTALQSACGFWNEFLNLTVENPEKDMEIDYEAILIQPPAEFQELCVPVKSSTSDQPMDRPFRLPVAYEDSLKKQLENVENLRRLVWCDEFDFSTRRWLESVIESRFKDWLNTTGNVRQISDLMTIEKQTKSLAGSNASSPISKATDHFGF